MDERRDTARIASVLRPLAPDILCFQEIHKKLPWSGREDQPAVLQSLLGRPFVFQANMKYFMGQYGVGIASRWEVIGQQQHMLPSVGEQRGALEVRYGGIAGGRRLTVFCTHWGLNDQERLSQAEKLAGLIKVAPGPVIVCGDLNEGPQGGAVTRLLELTGLADADAANNRPTISSTNPTDRIDYILFSPQVQCKRFEVICSPASDHCAIVADLILS
jgi:endonuclease/exonuclease/phosphatase family metal-dependent hydrolase